MRPEYGCCKECAAFVDEPSHVEAGYCKRGPTTEEKLHHDGCWSFIPKLKADAYKPSDFEGTGYPNREYKPSHEAREDVGKDGEVEE
jgi:hypothetical protein